MEYYTEVWYNISFSRYLLTTVVIENKFYDNEIKCDKGPYQGFTSLMFYISDYYFKPLNGNKRPLSEKKS